MAESPPTNAVAQARATPRAERLGWVLLVGGAVGAAAVFLLDVVLFRLTCLSQAQLYRNARIEACAPGTSDALQGVANVAIIVLAVTAVIGGVVCGARAHSGSRGRRRAIWLVLSTGVYIAALAWFAIGSLQLDLGFSTTMQYASLMSAGALAAWLAVSGVTVMIAAQLRPRHNP